MPATLKNLNYYGLFDSRLLAADAAMLLQKATGRSFVPIPYSSGAANGIFLLLDEKYENSSQEAGTVESDGKTFVRIKARYTTGISYALYSWLADLGFRFYLPGDEWMKVPKIAPVFVMKKTKKTYKPFFRIRMFSASGNMYPVKGLDDSVQNYKNWQQWQQRNRMGCDYLYIDGHIGEYFNMVHKSDIEKDSLIVAPVKGKRQYSLGAKLDPTYKKGVDLFSDWIVTEFKKKQSGMPGFLPFKKYVTADAGDGLYYCHTPACEEQFKSVSDQAFSIVNETARKIKIADSRAGVSTYAYTERADTPAVQIEPNVHVMVVPSAYQTVCTPTELMKRWSKKSKNISQYQYLNIGVWAYDMPFFNFKDYHANLRFLQSLKIEGIHYESSFSKFASGIQQYFILRFLAEPYSNPEKILDEFCQSNFGKAAAPLKSLLKEWYFSEVHQKTNRDKTSFEEGELGRFVQYLVAAENTPGLSDEVHKRINELKAYTVYLCKFYELFSDLENLTAFSTDPGSKSVKAAELLTYTWRLYGSMIFHNTQLNDMLKPFVDENERAKWDYKKSGYLKDIQTDEQLLIKKEFEAIRKKYLHLAVPLIELNDAFFAANVKYSADSILITTIDEAGFGNFLYPLEFYCSVPGALKINYQTDSSLAKERKGKVALVSVESSDYRYTLNQAMEKQGANGTLYFKVPAKGHYKLYLGQYGATHVAFTIFPGKNLFYLNKQSILMNGMLLQDAPEKNRYSNRYLGIYTPKIDSLCFHNLYYNSNNTSRIYSASGEKIAVVENKRAFNNAAAIPPAQKAPFVFYDNIVYRWPPVLKNTAPYYFFLKFPLY